MSASPTCKLCGETVTGISQTGDTVRFEPCGHSVPEDAKKHWLKKESEAVEDTYVPEDVAARDAVDRGEETVSRDDQLRDLLDYCRSKANGDNSYPHEVARNDAYNDVADRLSTILVGR